MNSKSSNTENEGSLQVTPKDNLEHLLMEEYLAEKGHTLAGLDALSPEFAKHLLAEASQFASLQMTEIETSAHLWTEVKG